MFSLQYKNWSWDAGLQIIHADVLLQAGGETFIDEPLCVDVGLPALLYGIYRDVEPDRWASALDYNRMPFLCCGCGDPECRAYSFRVRHLEANWLEITELEERQGTEPRVIGSFTVPLDEYKKQALSVAEQFLSFVEGLDYKPYFKDTVRVVRQLAGGAVPPVTDL